jgi:predicted nuclease with TOPRIM domain
MTPIESCCAAVRERLLAAIEFESRLAQKLREHENALLRGDVERIVTLNSELDGSLEKLKAIAVDLHSASSELALAVELPERSTLKDALDRVPDLEKRELVSLRSRLMRARRAAKGASTRNAAIARASIDAIHGVKRLITGESPAAIEVESSAGRLDAEA